MSSTSSLSKSELRKQREILAKYITNEQSKLIFAHTYYVLSSRWVERWKHYVDYDTPLDNVMQLCASINNENKICCSN